MAAAEYQLRALFLGGVLLQLFASTEILCAVRKVPSEYRTIQEAIDASMNDDIVQVAGGDYILDEPLQFHGIQMSIVGSETALKTKLIGSGFPKNDQIRSLVLMGKDDQAGVTIVDVEFREAKGTRRDNIPFLDCKSFAAQSSSGGAILIEQGAKLTLSRCIFEDCAAFGGGAITCMGSRLLAEDCLFTGNSTSSRNGGTGNFGGAVLCSSNAVATFIRCNFWDNVALCGGGVAVDCGADVSFESCAIEGNEAFGGSGGGIFCNQAKIALTDSALLGNTTIDGICGSGVHVTAFGAAVIERAVFRENIAANRGAAICVKEGGFLSIHNSIVQGNRSLDFSAGVACEGEVQMERVVFTDNVARSGAVAVNVTRGGRLRMTNCLLVNNISSIGAVGCEQNSDLTIVHCTVTGNPSGGIVRIQSAKLDIVNSILWGNQSEWGSLASLGDLGELSVMHSCVEGDQVIPGLGNTNANPMFVSQNDLHLQASSPAIDAGITQLGIERDLDGYARLCGPKVDMGAYEFGQCKPVVEFVRADVDPDGQIAISDAVAILGALFLGRRTECLDSADVQDDGVVNITDAVYLLSFLFNGGSPPALPWPACGLDPSTDDLPCDSFDFCGAGQ